MTTFAVRFEIVGARRPNVRLGAVVSLDGAQHDALLALLYESAIAGVLQSFTIAPVGQIAPVAIDASGRPVPPGRVLSADELRELLEAVLSR